MSFPWYDFAEMHPATNALWHALAALLAAEDIDAPTDLDRSRRHGVDDDGMCLFTQTCGYPLFTTARDQFVILGTPCYAVAGCAGPLHRSFIVVRHDAQLRSIDDLRGTRFAVNELDSNSGMNLPRRLFAPLARGGRFLGSTVITGSHAASAALVAAGAADAAGIDCVTYALLQRYRPDAVLPLRVIAQTAATPTPPLVTSRATSKRARDVLTRSLRAVARAPEYAALREALFIADIDFFQPSVYEIVMQFEREAAHLGYPKLQ